MLERNIRFFKYIPVVLFVSLLLVSCNSTKYVPDDKYLLQGNLIEVDNDDIRVADLSDLEKQKPNKRVLFTRFHLRMYNMSRPNKKNWFNNWLRRIGEAPVVYDSYLREKTKKQFRAYLHNKGFFNAEVTDTLLYGRKKRIWVYYKVKTGKPYTIRDISYNLEDKTLLPIIEGDSLNSLLKKGERYDKDVLMNERIRLEKKLKNLGYYKFSRNYIHYDLDSSFKDHTLSVSLKVKKALTGTGKAAKELESHIRYKIDSVFVFTNYSSTRAIAEKEKYFKLFDTTNYEGFKFLTPKKNKFSYNILKRSIHLEPHQLYSLQSQEQSHKNLASLGVFKFVNINYKENPDRFSDSLRGLNVYVQLSPQDVQSYTIEAELTNSGGNYGIAGNLIYSHKNLFRGMEHFKLRLKGAFESTGQDASGELRNTVELGGEVSIETPKFILPFRLERFVKNYNPNTRLSFAYNFQKRPYYNRTIANASWGYKWRGKRETSHTVTLTELNKISLELKDTAWFNNTIKNTYQENSFKDQTILASSYALSLTNQKRKKGGSFYYMRFKTEAAGNLLAIAKKQIFNASNDSIFWDNEYAQYMKFDLDFSFHQKLRNDNRLVYHWYSGVGLPYGNSKAMPFEKKYFVGGANSLRAWQGRTLGPGQYAADSISAYPNQLGDIRLEFNLEYRYKVFKKLEGALFIDMGNIWSIHSSDERQGAVFKFDQFYKDIAIGTGIGARFDFQFLMVRLDMGIKLRDPSNSYKSHWIIGNERLNWQDHFRFNFGIGYPF